MATDQVVNISARAFSGEGVRRHRCLVSPDGVVRVWDAVAGHYTTCHRLGRLAKRRAQKLARDKGDENECLD